MSLNQIFVTRKCNRKCSYCFAKDFLNEGNEIKISGFKYYLKYLNYYIRKGDVKNFINLLGGEPFEHSRISEILSILDTSAFENIVITTNGQFDLKILDIVKNTKKFSFSLSYPKNNIEHKNFVKLMDYLVKRKFNSSSINVVLTGKFEGLQILTNLKAYGINKVSPIIALPNLSKNNDYIHENNKDFNLMFFELIKNLYENNFSVGQHCFTPYCFFTKQQIKYLLNKGFNFGQCKNYDSIFVYPSLDVFICPFFDTNLGNLKNNSYSELKLNISNLLKKRNVNCMFEKCKRCKLHKLKICVPCAAYNSK